MNFGKALSFISPAAGMLSGNGAGLLPYLSPGFGMLSGKGPFGKMVDDEDDPIRKLLGGALGGGMLGGGQKAGMFGAGMPMGIMGMFGGGN
jgi:hypothetical protein